MSFWDKLWMYPLSVFMAFAPFIGVGWLLYTVENQPDSMPVESVETTPLEPEEPLTAGEEAQMHEDYESQYLY